MNCADVEHRLSALLDDEAEDRASLLAHVEACPACRELWRDLQAQHETLEALGADLRARASALEGRIGRAIAPKPRGWLAWALVPVAAAAGMLVGAFFFRGATPPTPTRGVATLQAATGIVQCQAGGAWDALAAGEAVPRGARVRTVGGARASFGTADGSEVVLRDGSQAAFEGPRDVALEFGTVWARVAQGGAFEVSMGDARAVATGTELAVARKPTGSEVWVVDGRVRVEAGSSSRDVAAGQSCRIAGGAVEEPRAVERLALVTSWVLDVQAAGGRDRERLRERIRRLLVELGQTKLEELSEEEIRSMGGGCEASIAAYVDDGESRRDADLRRHGARLLADIATLEVAPDLVRLLEDDDGEVRASAAQALERLAGGQDYGCSRDSWTAGSQEVRARTVEQWRSWCADRDGR